jgi:cytochrome P450
MTMTSEKYDMTVSMTLVSATLVDMTHTSEITDMHESVRKYPFSRIALDPDPQYSELRRSEPVCRVQLPYGPPAWLVTDYHLAKAVFTDPRFSRAAAVDRDNPRETLADLSQVAESIMSMDGAEHARLRKLVSHAFTPRRVEQMRPRVREVASGLIDAMVAAGPPADLVSSFSYALPAIVICELLGIPEADQLQFRRWTDGVVSSTAGDEEQQQIFMHLAGYLAGLFAQRHQHPGDDLLTWLVQAGDNDDRLTESELLFLGMAILVGGYESTAHEITNMVYTLLTHPEQLEQLRAHPEMLPTAVEELLRFIVLGTPPTPRIATADVQLGEVQVQAGDPVMVVANSANRDESVFSNPDDLDLARHPNPHIAFGYGPHFCLGAQLARLELQVSLETIVPRLPGLRLAVPEDDLAWRTGSFIRGLTTFPVMWEDRAACQAR